jgi:plasmid replication initiation protein
MNDTDRQHGKLTYSFDHRLVDLLRKSTIFGKLEIAVMMAFSSKYALALYEAIARRVRLQHKFSEEFTLEEFRDLIGVEDGKLEKFSNLNLKAIKPAVAEINAMASFGIEISPLKEGRKVVRIYIGWWQKDVDDLKIAFAEVRRTRVGRKARINDRVEETVQMDLPTLGV